MGIYLDPGYESFKSAITSDIYVDKTELISILNKKIGKEKRYFAVSRARRFGKSMIAGMLKAYYSIGCDSRKIFAPFKISKMPDFEEHLNKYHVLHFDMATFLNEANNYKLKLGNLRPEEDDEKTRNIRENSNPINLMNNTLMREFKEKYTEIISDDVKVVSEAIVQVWKNDGIKFVIIIDEWDCIIRDAKTDENLIMDYLKCLRGFFKTEESKEFLALGYITGILPIKKFNGESAMNNFTEYTMIRPKQLAPYFGFSDEEVRELCDDDEIMDMDEVRRWYDGYLMKYIAPDRSKTILHMYNPNSLVEAITDGECLSYWKNTGAFGGLNDYIALNMDGLKDIILEMLAGSEYPVDTETYQNDLTSFKSKDDVITALIHMGYLGYNPETKCAYIPNEEVRDVFESAIKVGDWDDIIDALRRSDELLQATWDGDSDMVRKVISESHQDYTSILEYHDENSLALAIMMSYYTARKHYMIVREFPSGKGFADIAFIPKKGSDKTAMIVELKWNKDSEAAIDQIKDNKYTGKLCEYGADILLVGINYDKKSKEYSCVIERMR